MLPKTMFSFHSLEYIFRKFITLNEIWIIEHDRKKHCFALRLFTSKKRTKRTEFTVLIYIFLFAEFPAYKKTF
jgi:hypothetical protein